ncbi:hypothetical protein AACH06_22365 [Ideonella sp. DXS29W]|uniref:Uncharacterized protein n=1 Tax=Ideonella lacteola TaxID=2984193 RepID=A0ABU9BYA9_9BURK
MFELSQHYPIGRLVATPEALETQAYRNRELQRMNARLPTIIGLWRPVSTCVSRWAHDVRQFRHIGTVLAQPTIDDDCKRGQVVWGVPDTDCPLALCWDWAEVRVGVVALANPMTVFSNVRLLAEDGAPLSHGQTLLELNGVIHELNWQRQLCDELSFRRCRASNQRQTVRQSRVNAVRSRSSGGASLGMAVALS